MKDYVIKKRNKENSVFVVQKKLEGLPLLFRCLFRSKEISEGDILFLMGLDTQFLTYNREDGSYTPVFRRGYHIRSKITGTRVDNIGNLPLI
jgi:hypothetical protein